MKFEFVTSRVKPSISENRRTITVNPSDLPLHCPRKEESRWNMHPRVFIPLEQSALGEATCPYCGNLYKLSDESE